jgi:predicted nucleic acid-binding protein
VRFWDTSALAPLFVDDHGTEAVTALLSHDPAVVVWTFTSVELVSMVARMRRTSTGADDLLMAARSEVLRQWPGWREVSDVEPVRLRALRLVGVHPLKAADALQLAAAMHASGDRPELLPFVTLDRQLATAAELEGFRVMFPAVRQPR